MDPLQFPHCAGRGVDEAKKKKIIDTVPTNWNTLHHIQTAVCSILLCINALQPHILAEKHSTHLHLDHQLILWITDLLINRSQRVLVNNTLSGISDTSTSSLRLCPLTSALMTAGPPIQTVIC